MKREWNTALSIAAYFPFARVIPVHQSVQSLGSETRSLIRLAPLPGTCPICSGCRQPVVALHSYGTRQVRDLNLAHAVVEILVPQRRLRCPTCGVFVDLSAVG